MNDMSYVERLDAQIKCVMGKQKNPLKKMKTLATKNETDSDEEIEYIVDENVFPVRDYATYYDSDHDDTITKDVDDMPDRYVPVYYDSDE